MIRYQIERFFLICFGRILAKNRHTNLTRVHPESQGQSICEKRLTKVHLGRGLQLHWGYRMVSGRLHWRWRKLRQWSKVVSHALLSYCKPGNLGHRVSLLHSDISYMIYPTCDCHLARKKQIILQFRREGDVESHIQICYTRNFQHLESTLHSQPLPKHIFLLSLRRPLKHVPGATVYIPKLHLLLNIISLGHFGA